MTIEDLIKKGYDLIYKGASAFPYSNDLMHVGIIGTLPFLVGKYTSECLGRKHPLLKKHSTKIGLATSGLSEVLWQFMIEPKSKYDHPGDLSGDLRGVIDTTIGAGLGYLLSRLIERRKLK